MDNIADFIFLVMFIVVDFIVISFLNIGGNKENESK